MTDRSSKHSNGDPNWGYVATRKGDAIRVDIYTGRTKVKNVTHYLDATTWPAERIDQLNMAYWLARNPTLLYGPSLRNGRGGYAAMWRNAEAMMKAINEVVP